MAVITRDGLIVHIDEARRPASVWDATRRVRISTREQVRFASAASQAMRLGLRVDLAMSAAATLVGWRLAHVIRLAGIYVRAGYALSDSFRLTEFQMSDAMLDALDIGEERSDVVGELISYARRTNVAIALRTTRRSTHVRSFATALVSTLDRQPFSPAVIRDVARRLNASNRFRSVVAKLADDVESSWSFGEALARCPAWFDGHFCRCIQACDSRDRLRRGLQTLVAPWPPEVT